MSENTQGLSISRIGVRNYVARNARGGEIVIGDGDGEFSPGDLVKIAVLGCGALSSDARFARALGDDYKLDGQVTASYSQEDDRFTQFFVELFPQMGFIEEADREQLLRRANGAIERYCTISHTLAAGAPTSVQIDGQQL